MPTRRRSTTRTSPRNRLTSSSPDRRPSRGSPEDSPACDRGDPKQRQRTPGDVEAPRGRGQTDRGASLSSGGGSGSLFQDRADALTAVSYTHLRAHETDSYLVCRL